MQVCTLWQAVVSVIHAGCAPDVVAFINAVAKEAGEPSAEVLFAAAKSSTVGEQGNRKYLCYVS